MQRMLILSAGLLGIFSSLQVSAQQAWRITPGKSVGYTEIGETADSLSRKIGKPDAGDAAMGKAWAVYYSRNASNMVRDSGRFLAIYLERDRPDEAVGMRVKQIRVNTASFRANNDIKVGSPLKKIKEIYPGMTRAGIYVDTITHTRYYLYDAVRNGIGFEVNTNTNTCTAITVHAPAEKITGTYLAMPGMERMKKVL